jgi:hypothetical protein
MSDQGPGGLRAWPISGPFPAVGSFTRSLSDSKAVRQLPDGIARFPAPHWMPLVSGTNSPSTAITEG